MSFRAKKVMRNAHDLRSRGTRCSPALAEKHFTAEYAEIAEKRIYLALGMAGGAGCFSVV